MLDHELAQLAFRALAETLSVATTGSTTLVATTTGFTRAAGSFLTDGFRVGMEVTPSGFNDNTVSTIKSVSALSVGLRDARAAEVSASGRTLTVGLPASRAWENARFKPVQGVPYVEEQYLPGPSTLDSLGAAGDMTLGPTYVLYVYVPQNTGILADGKYADALLSLFAPSTEILLSSGDFLQVLANPAPFRGQRRTVDGFSVIPVTIPTSCYTQNADTTNPFYVIFTDVDGDIAISSSLTAAADNYQVAFIDSDGDPSAP